MTKIYTIEKARTNEGKDIGLFKGYQTGQCTKVDGHLHSKYSGIHPDLFLQSAITRALGVRESYSEIKNIHRTVKKRGMSFSTISDHDSVVGALAMRKLYPEDTMVNCEYTVAVSKEDDESQKKPGFLARIFRPFRSRRKMEKEEREKRKRNRQSIHVGVWGLDYAGESAKPLTRGEVFKLHLELLHKAEEGYESFIEFCEQAKICYALNHPAWQGSPSKPFTGKQFDDITDAFKVFEINGDMQLENLIALELAIEKGKTICAGSDSHSTRRLGKTFTATLSPVSSPSEFLQEFKKGNIGIGSAYPLPEGLAQETREDIIRHKFNGPVSDFRDDIYQIMLSYILKDQSFKKFASVGAIVGGAAALSYTLSWAFVPVLAALLVGSFASVPFGMAMIEKNSLAVRAKKLYKDYLDHCGFQEEIARILADPTKEEKERQEEIEKLHSEAIKQAHEKPNPKYQAFEAIDLQKNLSWWDWQMYRLLHPIKLFHAEYDLANTPRIDEAHVLEEVLDRRK